MSPAYWQNLTLTLIRTLTRDLTATSALNLAASCTTMFAALAHLF
jgi:hypothetical protein